MATPAAQTWKSSLQIEKQLLSLLGKDQAPRFDDVDNMINQLRIACEQTILHDFEYAYHEGVEQRLWDAHIKINSRYRKIVGHYRHGDAKKHVVERRKLEKRYVDFIKTSQFFYKGYIQRLAAHFEGMNKLRRIAHRLSLSPLTVDRRIQVNLAVEKLIDMSCHATLLRLGDLSRYRNDLRSKDKSWGPALGYYGLANDLVPDDGSAHNQMAVIALADADHLGAIYHLYRALTVNDPHKLARGNLELEFKKIMGSWEKNDSLKPKTDSLSTLVWWFVLLHAKFYEGYDFSTHEELENEVLSRLTLLLKEQAFNETLQKLVLVNISAEFFAGQRIKEQSSPSQETIRSFYFCFSFNVRMMFMLLQLVQPELEDPATAEENDDLHAGKPQEKITPLIHRILPALRQYSVWLVSQAEFLVAKLDRGQLNIHINEMWKLYADVLSRFANSFPAQTLPLVPYLLEEDESTVGFKPLRDPDLPHPCNLYSADEEGNLKSHISDSDIQRYLPNVEMQGRVRDILLCGLVLQSDEKYPIILQDGQFIFVEEGLPITSFATPGHPQVSVTPRSPAHASNSFKKPECANNSRLLVTNGSNTASDSHSMDSDMRHMVSGIVDYQNRRQTFDSDETTYDMRSFTNMSRQPAGSDETSYGMNSYTANETFSPETESNLNVARPQSTPKMLPSLPGIWSTPFTPQPNELQPNCYRPSMEVSGVGSGKP